MSVVTSASATTRYYGLPIFEADDKPSYLTDWNGTMTEIDSLLKAQHDDIEANKGDILGLLTRQSRLENALNSLDVIAQTLSNHLSLAEADIQTIKNTLIQIDTEVKNTSSRVTALTTRVENLESRANGFDTSLSGLASELQEQTGDISDLQTGLTNETANRQTADNSTLARATYNSLADLKAMGIFEYSPRNYVRGEMCYVIDEDDPNLFNVFRCKYNQTTPSAPTPNNSDWFYFVSATGLGVSDAVRYATDNTLCLFGNNQRGKINYLFSGGIVNGVKYKATTLSQDGNYIDLIDEMKDAPVMNAQERKASGNSLEHTQISFDTYETMLVLKFKAQDVDSHINKPLRLVLQVADPNERIQTGSTPRPKSATLCTFEGDPDLSEITPSSVITRKEVGCSTNMLVSGSTTKQIEILFSDFKGFAGANCIFFPLPWSASDVSLEYSSGEMYYSEDERVIDNFTIYSVS